MRSGVASCTPIPMMSPSGTRLLHAQRPSGNSVLAQRRPVKRRPAAVLTRSRRERIVMSCAWERMAPRWPGPQRRERPPQLHRLRARIASPRRETRTASRSALTCGPLEELESSLRRASDPRRHRGRAACARLRALPAAADDAGATRRAWPVSGRGRPRGGADNRARPRSVRYHSPLRAASRPRGSARPATPAARARPDPLAAPVGCRTHVS